LGKLQGVVNFYECLKETLLVYAARISSLLEGAEW
jgi:hypothetical protein